MQKRIRIFEEANRTINKQRKAKKIRIQQRRIFSIQNANTLLNTREVDTQLEKEMRTSGHGRDGGRTIIQRCGNCSEPKYNMCICKKDEEMFNIYSSD